ncbi:MAG TPA: hypothetical protein DCF33_01740 [Saprospirales bacterium]|nr:hypothetical protein [Saprospirales bacterium]
MNLLIVKEEKSLIKGAFFTVLSLLFLLSASSLQAQVQASSLTVSSAQTVDAAGNHPSQRMISCDVVYGGQGVCSGAGICRISPRSTVGQLAMERKLGCKSTIGLLFPLADGNGLSLVLTKQMLCQQFYNSHLQQGILVQENSADIAPEVIQSLGLKFTQIRPGNYPVVEEAGKLRIDFNASGQ